MASAKPKHTLTDYVASAMSPALIMVLVGSLVFFLVEVLYIGQYTGQLLWCLACFVFAAVLVARISIEGGWARASLFGLALAVAVWLALQFYVDYPEDSPAQDFKGIINLVVIAVTWWCAHKLTWDCTHVEERDNDGGQGLLQAAGLEKPAGNAVRENEPLPEEEKEPRGWWERYKRYCQERRTRRTPGVWVIYFSLAALPLFGLGQSLIPAEEEERRRYVFWLMVFYIAGGLGLLLTTTFLGLRRYLLQRQVKMPAALTAGWLTTGGIIIVVLLALGAVLPRPAPEYPLVEVPGLGSPKRDASRWAVLGGKPGKGEGRPSGQKPPDDQKDNSDAKNQGKPGEDGQKTNDKSAPPGKDGKQGEGGKDGKQGGGKDNAQGKSGGDQGDKRGKPGDDKNRSPEQQKQEGDKKDEQKQPDQNGGRPQLSSGGQQQQRNEPRQNPQSSGGKSFMGSLSAALASVAPFLRWLVFAAIVLVVGFLVLRGGLRFLSNFSDWAKGILDAFRSWWESLFGSRRERASGEAAIEEPVRRAPPRPFASFGNPFTDGRAERLPIEKLVRYSFEALEAWAWERDLGRRQDETALEFGERVGADVPALEADARRLAALYARALYGRGTLPASSVDVVRLFWERLEAVVEQPLSA
jgi:hypothetical protein